MANPSNPTPSPAEHLPRTDKIYALRRCPLFKAMNAWELGSVSNVARLVEYKKDEIVFNEDDKATSFFVVVSGRFEAFVTEEGEKKTLAYVKQPGFFGEMSLLSGENHSATVRALSDSLVLAIPKSEFDKILASNAKISLEFNKALTARLRGQSFKKNEKYAQHLLRSDVISVYSTHRKTDKTAFSTNLAAALFSETGQKTVLVDMSPTGRVIAKRLSIHDESRIRSLMDLEKDIEGTIKSSLVSHPSGFEVLNLASEKIGRGGGELAVHFLNHLAASFRFIIVNLPNRIDDAILKMMLQSDHLCFVTDNNLPNVSEVQSIMQDLQKSYDLTDEKIKIVVTESLLGFTPTSQTRRELFGSKETYFLPSVPLDENISTDTSLVVLDFPDHDYSKVIRNLSRRISRNLIGIALGSGAALGFAHIGVLKVLEEEKIPIDAISGSSIGAVIGAFVAADFTAEKMEKIAASFTLMRMISRLDFDICPIRGFLVGKEIAKLFAGHLKDKQIEDLKIPLLIIASNIRTRKELIMKSGPLVPAIRASIAIPGVFHPLSVNGEAIIDGGIIDPLPIRPLAEAGVNKIIAVDVLPSSNDMLEKNRFYRELERRLETRVKRRNVFIRSLYRLRKSLGRAFTPNFFDVLVNSIQTMEHEIAASLSEEADVVIRPRMPHMEWVQFHKSKEMIRCGEIAAREMVDEIKTLVKQPTV